MPSLVARSNGHDFIGDIQQSQTSLCFTAVWVGGRGEAGGREFFFFVWGGVRANMYVSECVRAFARVGVCWYQSRKERRQMTHEEGRGTRHAKQKGRQERRDRRDEQRE
jgi:hypothetical protein